MLGLDVGGDQIKVALPGNRLVFPSSLITGGNLNNNASFAEYQGEIWQTTDTLTKPKTIAELARLAVLTIAEIVAAKTCQPAIPLLTLAIPLDLFIQKTIWIEWLQGPHQVRFLNKGGTQVCVVIEDVLLLPQAYSAFFSHVLDSEGAKIEERLRSTLIIDCGANTLTIASTTERGSYQKNFSLTLRSPHLEADEVLVAAHLSAQVKTNPEQVLVCGGRAETLLPAIQLKWPQATLLPDPLFANAVGSLRYAIRHKNCS